MTGIKGSDHLKSSSMQVAKGYTLTLGANPSTYEFAAGFLPPSQPAYTSSIFGLTFGLVYDFRQSGDGSQ